MRAVKKLLSPVLLPRRGAAVAPARADRHRPRARRRRRTSPVTARPGHGQVTLTWPAHRDRGRPSFWPSARTAMRLPAERDGRLSDRSRGRRHVLLRGSGHGARAAGPGQPPVLLRVTLLDNVTVPCRSRTTGAARSRCSPSSPTAGWESRPRSCATPARTRPRATWTARALDPGGRPEPLGAETDLGLTRCSCIPYDAERRARPRSAPGRDGEGRWPRHLAFDLDGKGSSC
jgi:hypothetical protein